MAFSSPDPSPASEGFNADDVLLKLRRKEGSWQEWGQWCQQLQKSGYSPQQIFEATGFEPIQQNQLTIATQVYGSLISVGVSDTVKARFERTGSDSLYELRVLTQTERAAAAELIVEKGIDSEGSKEVAKALKDYSRLAKPPEEFKVYPADAIAHYYWKLARQQADLQMRSRLIALALRFAASDSARIQVEKLLTDFTVSKQQKSPRVPLYRMESADDQPRIMPVVGKLPMTVEDLKAVPLVEDEGPFHMLRFVGAGAWVALPGWQVVRTAEDPVVVLADHTHLVLEDEAEGELLLLIDRAQREWDDNSYFIVEREGQLCIDWFASEPGEPLLGQVKVVLRPRKVLDEDFNNDIWQYEE
jgi:Rubisco Assembly chaperone C-terminal domain/Rubisco accumulation factor 1 alpha helical domain/Rubisco accumulation factor 1 helix turn helix domain